MQLIEYFNRSVKCHNNEYLILYDENHLMKLEQQLPRSRIISHVLVYIERALWRWVFPISKDQDARCEVQYEPLSISTFYSFGLKLVAYGSKQNKKLKKKLRPVGSGCHTRAWTPQHHQQEGDVCRRTNDKAHTQEQQLAVHTPPHLFTIDRNTFKQTDHAAHTPHLFSNTRTNRHA
jgi:hypothetical protein